MIQLSIEECGERTSSATSQPLTVSRHWVDFFNGFAARISINDADIILRKPIPNERISNGTVCLFDFFSASSINENSIDKSESQLLDYSWRNQSHSQSAPICGCSMCTSYHEIYVCQNHFFFCCWFEIGNILFLS